MSRQSATVTFSTRASRLTPALDTTMSSPPKRRTAASMSAATDVGSVISTGWKSTRSPNRSWSFGTSPGRRAAQSTDAPSARNSPAIACPNPLVPPVTTATRPDSLIPP